MYLNFYIFCQNDQPVNFIFSHSVEEKMPAKPEMAASSSTICHYLDNVQEEHWLPGDQRGAAGMDSTMYM